MTLRSAFVRRRVGQWLVVGGALSPADAEHHATKFMPKTREFGQLYTLQSRHTVGIKNGQAGATSELPEPRVSPDAMASAVAVASAWVERNRDWIEAGGSGDLPRLVSDLATHLHQSCASRG